MSKRKDKLASRNHVYAVQYTRYITYLTTNQKTEGEFVIYTPANDKREAMDAAKRMKEQQREIPGTRVRNVFSLDKVTRVSKPVKKHI